MSPRYEYKCPSCGISIEQVRAYDQDGADPMCGDCLVSMNRVYSSPSIQFKGSGWGGDK